MFAQVHQKLHRKQNKMCACCYVWQLSETVNVTLEQWPQETEESGQSVNVFGRCPRTLPDRKNPLLCSQWIRLKFCLVLSRHSCYIDLCVIHVASGWQVCRMKTYGGWQLTPAFRRHPERPELCCGAGLRVVYKGRGAAESHVDVLDEGGVETEVGWSSGRTARNSSEHSAQSCWGEVGITEASQHLAL